MSSFQQVNVFSSNKLKGNPLAVVTCDSEPSDKQMLDFAQWTNLSETTFLLPPKNAESDYFVRIWTPTGELPFAGHPTLGTAHVWLANTGSTKQEIIQECGAGLISVIRKDNQLAFKAPACKQREMDAATLDQILDALSLTRDDVAQSLVLENGPVFHALLLKSSAKVLEPTPDWSKFPHIHICGLCAVRDDGVLEVRSIVVEEKCEDPITGSLNAALAKWLLGNGTLSGSYVANQGRSIGREGVIGVTVKGEDIWVAGDVQTVITGTVNL